MNKKKKKKNRLKPQIKFLLWVSGCLFFAVSIVGDATTILGIRAQINTNSRELEQVEIRRSSLEKTRKNLSNPDYIEYSARGTYNVSQPGEQIIKFAPLDGE